MLAFPAGTEVVLAVGPSDLRRGIDGLALLVAGAFGEEACSGKVFGFANRRRDLVKLLYWDRNGFCLWQKRLEEDRFCWPSSAAEVARLTFRELQYLLDGLSLPVQTRVRQVSATRVA